MGGYHDHPGPQKRYRPVRLLRPCEGTRPLFRLTVPRQHDLELSTSGGGIEGLRAAM